MTSKKSQKQVRSIHCLEWHCCKGESIIEEMHKTERVFKRLLIAQADKVINVAILMIQHNRAAKVQEKTKTLMILRATSKAVGLFQRYQTENHSF